MKGFGGYEIQRLEICPKSNYQDWKSYAVVSMGQKDLIPH